MQKNISISKRIEQSKTESYGCGSTIQILQKKFGAVGNIVNIPVAVNE